MKLQLAWLWALAVLLAGAGCQKKEAPAAPPAASQPKAPEGVALVPKAERSGHFAAVNRHLELGGTLYGYADVDGDVLKLADALQNLADQVAAAQPLAGALLKQDFAAIFTLAGLADIKAFGFSSVPAAGGGFRNRAFFYTPEGRHGLLLGLGGPAAPFAHARLAPEDADFFAEGEVDLPEVYATVKSIVVRVAGEETVSLMENSLRQAGAKSGVSVLQLLQSFKGRSAMVMRFDPERTLSVPGKTPLTLPAFSLLVRLEGIGPAIEGALAKAPVFQRSEEGARRYYALPLPLPLSGLKPLLAVEGSALHFATTREFLDECLGREKGLDQNADFQRQLGEVGREGNRLVYVSPRLFNRLREIDDLNPDAPEQMKRVLQTIARQIPAVNRPLMAVRVNQADGILVRSFWNRSLKQEVAMVSMYNPVTVGLVAAMAIPAFQKARQASQARAEEAEEDEAQSIVQDDGMPAPTSVRPATTVSHERAIRNNLRQLSAAAGQFMKESGATRATYQDLVGPGRFIHEMNPVAGEDYTSMIIRAQDRTISIRTASGKIIMISR